MTQPLEESELVPGMTAGRLDLWRRILNIATIVVPLGLGLALAGLGLGGAVLATCMIVLLAGLFVASLVVGQFGARTLRLEMEAGYSTVLDVEGFELRDAVTKELLRASSTRPDPSARRSLLAGLFRVKPGTLLAKRIDDDEK